MRRREEQAEGSARLLDVEHRFLDFPDCGLEATPDAARAVAQVLADVRPDGLVTWGDAWVKGMRHPDHQAAGKIARDAVTYARIASCDPSAAAAPGLLPGLHDTRRPLRATARHRRRVAVGRTHLRARGLPPGRSSDSGIAGGSRTVCAPPGTVGGVEWGEAFEAWETHPGTVDLLLPAREILGHAHPTRKGTVP